MPLLNFREIGAAKTNAEAGEDFEALIRELGKKLNLEPEWSGRGSDQGRDLIFTERRLGSLGHRDIRWLVNCKNFAQSGRSVNEGDIGTILEKTVQHKASGFLIACTTTVSTGLKSMLDAISSEGKLETKILDRTELETLLLQDSNIDLVKRYMPESYIGLSRFTSLPLALSSLEIIVPKPIYNRISNLIKTYQFEGRWLTGEHIWPRDVQSAKVIDTVLSELLDRNDSAKAAYLLATGGVEFDAFSATLKVLTTLKPDAAKLLSRELIRRSDPKGSSLFAYHFYVEHFEPSSEEQVQIASDLDREDISEVYGEEIIDFIEQELTGDPGKYRAWDDLDSLSSRTRIEEVYTSNIKFYAEKDHNRIKFDAKIVFGTELVYDKETGTSMSFPGQAHGHIDAYGTHLDDATVDISSFHE